MIHIFNQALPFSSIQKLKVFTFIGDSSEYIKTAFEKARCCETGEEQYVPCYCLVEKGSK